MKNHGLWMIIGCVLPFLLIYILPAFGVSSQGAFVVFIILMFACHFMMLGHHHGGEDADEKAPNTIKTTPKRTMTVIQKLTEYATTTQKGRR
jgi:hypothetical protein